RRPRQRAEPRILETQEKLRHRKPERRRALKDLERREGMDVDVRHRRLDRAAHRLVGRAGIVGMNATLEANLDSAALPCFAHAPGDLFETEIVRSAAQ